MSKEVGKALVEAAARMGKPHERVCLRVLVEIRSAAAARQW